jgi:hypothetical protein
MIGGGVGWGLPSPWCFWNPFFFLCLRLTATASTAVVSRTWTLYQMSSADEIQQDDCIL